MEELETKKYAGILYSLAYTPRDRKR